MAITLRTTKGSKLTIQEMDGNFTYLDETTTSVKPVIKTIDPTPSDNISTGYPLNKHWVNSTSGDEFIHKTDGVWVKILTNDILSTSLTETVPGKAADATVIKTFNDNKYPKLQNGTGSFSNIASTAQDLVGMGFILSNAYLYSANLSGADLNNANLSGANLSGANLYNANLYNANLSGAILSVANLSGASFLAGADFSNAYLYGADLSDAYLAGADFSNADLSDANLSGANLSNANLQNAILYNAILYNANLNNANLAGADLTIYYQVKGDFTGAIGIDDSYLLSSFSDPYPGDAFTGVTGKVWNYVEYGYMDENDNYVFEGYRWE